MIRRKSTTTAKAISDRSGLRFPMSEMVVEPGTGYLVHRSETDGEYNAVTHPQANLTRYVKFAGDNLPVYNARARQNTVVDLFLEVEEGDNLLNERGQELEVQ